MIERVEVLVRPEWPIRIPAGGRAEVRLRDDSERGEFEVFDREGHLLDRIPCRVDNFPALARRILQIRRAQCN